MAKHLNAAIASTGGRIKLQQVFMMMMTEKAQVWFAMDGEECISVVVTEICEWVI